MLIVTLLIVYGTLYFANRMCLIRTTIKQNSVILALREAYVKMCKYEHCII